MEILVIETLNFRGPANSLSLHFQGSKVPIPKDSILAFYYSGYDRTDTVVQVILALLTQWSQLSTPQ